jgi:hypothetical protein
MIRKLGDTVCDPHHIRGGDEKRGFPGLASKPLRQILDLVLKTKVDSLMIWISKSS